MKIRNKRERRELVTPYDLGDTFATAERDREVEVDGQLVTERVVAPVTVVEVDEVFEVPAAWGERLLLQPDNYEAADAAGEAFLATFEPAPADEADVEPEAAPAAKSTRKAKAAAAEASTEENPA